VQPWKSAWEEFVPFLEFPVELRRIVYTTNAVESLNARWSSPGSVDTVDYAAIASG
jgi:transposase-like protein